MNTTPKTLIAAITIALLVPLSALADDAHHKPVAGASADAAEMTDGEVRKVDMEAGKVTLKHADIKSLDMPAMTMVFVVKDKALLEKTSVGAKIQFMATNENGQMTVTDIQPAK